MYGFDLKSIKSEGKHLAKSIQADSPASRAGLREGDYIIEVNGDLVDGLDRDLVVGKMFRNPLQVELLVVEDLKVYLDNVNQRKQLKKEFKKETLANDRRIRTSSMIVSSTEGIYDFVDNELLKINKNFLKPSPKMEFEC